MNSTRGSGILFPGNSQNATASETKPIKTVRDLNSKFNDFKDETKSQLDQANTLLSRIERRQDSMEQLVTLGFIFLAFTALGIAIGFLNLVVDVYTFINTKF